MLRDGLRDDQWERIKDSLPGKAGDPGVTAKDNRLFMDAVLWIGRTGAPWRDLAPKYGGWHTVYTRFARWAKKGVWERLGCAVADDLDLEEVLLDSTIVRAHQHAAGARKAAGPQALGRSRGGWSSKLHALVDALGNPLSLRLTAGQAADIHQAEPLLESVLPGAKAVIADKSYDADALIEHIEQAGAEAVIPPRAHRKQPRAYDQHRYQARHLVERFFNRIKQFRRVATRYEKLAMHFLGMVTVAAIYVWLL